MEIASWITQLLIMSVLIAVVAGAGAPPRDGREPPTVREEFDDLIYRLRRLATRLKRRWQQLGMEESSPTSLTEARDATGSEVATTYYKL